jgi:dissimilatory sulfite reductase (desulfoviridin) alpha/beta subunit
MVKVPVNVNVNNDIEKFARLANGYQQQTVSSTEFKAFRVPMGVYEQRKNEVYMARIRATGGVIKPEQLLRVIDIAKENGSNLLHITTRAEVQILNLQLDKMENVLRQLQEAGLSTKGGGGNTVRNIIVSEFSGIDKGEVFDTTPYAIALANAVVPEPDSYLMPRKMKIAFSSNDKFIDYAGINDIGFVAQIKDGKRGFKVYIGGGAGSKPSVGWLWRDFLPAEDLYALVKAMKKFFIDHGNRKDKYKARIRFIFYKLGKEETFRLIDEYFEKEKEDSPLTPLLERGGQNASTNGNNSGNSSQKDNTYSSPLLKRGVGGESFVLNDPTLPLLAEMAYQHALAGADFVAPSAMMDGQIEALRKKLDSDPLTKKTKILAYSAKYASAYYGPFRDAACSAPGFGDRRSYQMDYRTKNQGLEEIEADIEEGTDWIMVKPALAYLDIIQRASERFPDYPMVAYQVSGEYSMLLNAAEQGLFDEERIFHESLTAIRRAGAKYIISYYAKRYAQLFTNKH